MGCQISSNNIQRNLDQWQFCPFFWWVWLTQHLSCPVYNYFDIWEAQVEYAYSTASAVSIVSDKIKKKKKENWRINSRLTSSEGGWQLMQLFHFGPFHRRNKPLAPQPHFSQKSFQLLTLISLTPNWPRPDSTDWNQGGTLSNSTLS